MAGLETAESLAISSLYVLIGSHALQFPGLRALKAYGLCSDAANGARAYFGRRLVAIDA